jgi:hypothetical protein
MEAVFLDISKAFDTIPHAVIPDAVRRKGLPEHFIRLVNNSYKSMNTTIKQGKNEIPITIRRGVKQGDPLSPFIYNCITEPLLITLEDHPGYQITQSIKVSLLAFADDLLLTVNSIEQVTNLLHITETYLHDLGMTISSGKCVAFHIISTEDYWYMSEPILKSNSGNVYPPRMLLRRLLI